VLKNRLDLYRYQSHALPRFTETRTPVRVELLLKQHAGAPAKAVVKVGDRVREGDLVGEIAGAVSARVHASVTGRVILVDEERVVIESENGRGG
ncbi:MAG: 4Fe-4S dicluster domain-containing protein, partial [Candidatus Caldatribacteriaceae bacterium]